MKNMPDMGTLKKGYNEAYFADGSEDRIWNGAKKSLRKKSSSLKWAAPLAAGVTLLVTLLAVPQARAAVVEFLGRQFGVMDYLNMEQSSRPDNTAVANLVQRDINATAVANAATATDWVKGVRVTVDEVLYDCQYVYVKYSVDSGSVSFNGNGLPTEQNKNVQFKEFMPGVLTLPGGVTAQLLSCSGPIDKGNGIWGDVAQYDSTGLTLNGSVSAAFTVDFYDSVNTWSEGGHITGVQKKAGIVNVSLAFDATPGSQNVEEKNISGKAHSLSGNVVLTKYTESSSQYTFTNESVPLEGCSVSVESVQRKVTETTIRVHVALSPKVKGFSGKYNPISKGFVYIELKDGEKVVGAPTDYTDDGNGGIDMDLVAPMLSEDVSKLTVCTLFYHEKSINGTALTNNQPFTIKSGNGFDDRYSAMAADGGTFEVELMK